MFHTFFGLALLLFVEKSLAQSPDLGTAVNFVLFTSDGAVTNTGKSEYTGNVGTNNGPINGFGNVNGVMHDNNAVSSACAADVLTAYTQLNSAIPNFFPSSLLGNGDTLVAGVYKIFSTASLNGNLYLNAKGNPNALFIIQIQGAFSANANAKVLLVNGTQACNVFWKVEGMVNLATSTYMRGTVVANNAAIKLNSLDTLEGRLLSTTGAISVDGSVSIMPIGCGAAILTGPASPVLGTAACYAIFSGNGTVTNAGVSHLVGDIGTNVGTVAGFDSLLVSGKIHAKPDASTALCAADLQYAYNYLNVLTPDIELLYPVQFGHNLVLTPHTYLLNSATTFTGNVYLNAQNNANAVFVILVNGAFSTSTFSKVLLTNGAQAKNVYWKVEGAVHIDNFSTFVGTIICNNGAIGLNLGDSLIGRALTTSGALSTASLYGTKDKIGCSVTLPISLLYFKGISLTRAVQLSWSSINISNYSIDKSSDGIHFTDLAEIKNSTTLVDKPTTYTYKDNNPIALAYYRLATRAIDGKKTILQTTVVNSGEGVKVNSYRQAGNIYVQASGATAGSGILRLYSTDGLLISDQKVVLTQEQSTYCITKALSTGLYIVTLSSADGVIIYRNKLLFSSNMK